MHVALIGVTGRVGSRLLAELLQRGHHVTGIARNTGKAAARPGLVLQNGDANDAAQMTRLLAGHDAVFSALKFATTDAAALIGAVKASGVPRLLVVGGAGSLEVAPGKLLLHAPDFPAAWMPEAAGGLKFLDALRAERALDWTFLSPSAEFDPGARTGRFRVGSDTLLTDANGRSWISMEDYAVAFVDELEHPKHPRARFTVGY